jgi:hypothetical protein
MRVRWRQGSLMVTRSQKGAQRPLPPEAERLMMSERHAGAAQGGGSLGASQAAGQVWAAPARSGFGEQSQLDPIPQPILHERHVRQEDPHLRHQPPGERGAGQQQ